MGNEKIKCPYCGSEKLQIIGGGIQPLHKGFKSFTEYKCLEDELHVFRTEKFSNINK